MVGYEVDALSSACAPVGVKIAASSGAMMVSTNCCNGKNLMKS